jgi:DNA-binding transcriptional MerR regulator
MKLKQKEKARNLRKQGFSIREIEKELKISRASASLWVRDIKLSEQQQTDLGKRSKNKIIKHIYKLAEDRRNKFLLKREIYQQEGRKLVKNCEKDFIAGVMLYWAEGAKSRNSLGLANTDPELMSFYIKFIRKFFNPNEDKFKLRIRWFSNNGLSYNEIKNFWIKKLNLNDKQIKDSKDIHGKTNNCSQIGKFPYGIVVLEVHDTSIIQKIYGAIQEYVGFNNSKWVL